MRDGPKTVEPLLCRKARDQPNELAMRMEPISPELVLIDPELAARVRTRPPGESNGKVVPAEPAPGRRIVGAGAVAVPTPLTGGSQLVRPEDAAAVAVTKAEAPPAVRPKLLLAAAGLVSFSLGLLLPPIVGGDDPVPSARVGSPVEDTAAPRLPRSPAKPSASSIASTSGAATIQTVERRAEPAPPRQESSAQPRSRTARSPVQVKAPTRLFVWLPRRGAHYYGVRFLKGRRTVFEAWPTDARVTVPLQGTFRGQRFAFTNGRYRWVVRPAFGPRSRPRYGRPIVRSIWVVRDGVP